MVFVHGYDPWGTPTSSCDMWGSMGSVDIGHGDYYTSTSTSSTADVYWQDDGGPWYAWYDAHWPVEWANYSLWLGTW